MSIISKVADLRTAKENLRDATARATAASEALDAAYATLTAEVVAEAEREHEERLASGDTVYYILCGIYGERLVARVQRPRDRTTVCFFDAKEL